MFGPSITGMGRSRVLAEALREALEVQIVALGALTPEARALPRLYGIPARWISY
jgi:hypothetical protein